MLPALALLAGLGCAHAPEAGANAPRASGAALRAPGERVLVTGSRIPRPVGRDGLPVTDSPVKIYWRDDLGGTGEADLARAIRKLDVGAR